MACCNEGVDVDIDDDGAGVDGEGAMVDGGGYGCEYVGGNGDGDGGYEDELYVELLKDRVRILCGKSTLPAIEFTRKSRAAS